MDEPCSCGFIFFHRFGFGGCHAQTSSRAVKFGLGFAVVIDSSLTLMKRTNI